MNYELAKKLKEAGFPVKTKETEKTEILIAPSLSELIDACGEEFADLRRGRKWLARGGEWLEKYDDIYEHEIEGETPEIAVANLYIKLNEETA